MAFPPTIFPEVPPNPRMQLNARAQALGINPFKYDTPKLEQILAFLEHQQDDTFPEPMNQTMSPPDLLKYLENYHPVFTTIEYRVNKSGPYEAKEEKVLQDPREFARILRYHTHVILPSGRKYHSVEYAALQGPQFIQQVVGVFGFIYLTATIEVFVDLLWYLCVNTEKLTLDPYVRAGASLLSEEQLRKLVHGQPWESHALMLYELTTGVHYQPPRDFNHPPKRGKPWSSVDLEPLRDRIEVVRNMPPLHAVRSALYAFIDDSHRKLGSDIPGLYQLLMLSRAPSVLEPFVRLFEDEVPEPQVEAELATLKFLVPDVERIVAGYTTKSNVESLAPPLGMMFPPHLITPAQKENYYFENLILYESLFTKQTPQTPPPDRNIDLEGQKLHDYLSVYTDFEIIETWGPFVWKDREELFILVGERLEKEYKERNEEEEGSGEED